MNNIVLHIPHSSLRLPCKFFKNVITDKQKVISFNQDITDLYTNELFGKNTFKKVIAKYSRIFCDTEKFTDDNKEVMSKFGMGFVYSHTNKGENFIKISTDYKNKILNNYYKKYHTKLDTLVEKSLRNKKTILLDCHSFSRDIIMFEDKKENLPDICIGFDNLYYNETLINYIKSYFENLGYTTNFNYPYSGTIIPNKYFQEKTDNLYCAMIEINKKLYLDENNNKNSNFKKIRNQIQKLLKELKIMKL